MTQSRFGPYIASNPWASPYGKPPELVSFKLLLDTRTLVFVMRGGEIATAPLDEETVTVRILRVPLANAHSIAKVDVVGNIDAGILAASWSPDDSLLVLVTGLPDAAPMCTGS